MEDKTTRVKICGITNLDDALVAAEAGADLIGFIFVSGSPRYVKPEQVAKITLSLRASGMSSSFVGVFVNESPERVRAVIEIAQLDRVQLHGDESPHKVQELSACRGYKALRPRNDSEAKALVAEYRSAVNGNVPAFIVDAFDAQKYGGTGQRVDWNIAARIARDLPILLAGGLNPENVADAIRAVRPWGVDVSSGVERAAGLKDHDKVRRFIQSVKDVK